VTLDEAWLAQAWPFVREQIPVTRPRRVLDIGCGPLGGFVPMLRREGHDAVGVDPLAPDGPHYARVEFERYDPSQEFDAVVASTSLHHVTDLDEVLDKIRALLAPGGLVIVVEWAWERVDESTARWCFARLDPDGEPGWLHARRDEWAESGRTWSAYVNAWAATKGLHSSQRIREGLDARFDGMVSALGPCYFPELAHTTASDEQAAIDSGAIQAGATYYVGRTRSR
jgi:SAM-dependent methyltransferase